MFVEVRSIFSEMNDYATFGAFTPVVLGCCVDAQRGVHGTTTAKGNCWGFWIRTSAVHVGTPVHPVTAAWA